MARMLRNNAFLLLVVLVATLQRARPLSAAAVEHPKVRIAEKHNQEDELQKVISKENYNDLESRSKLHHDQLMAKGTRSETAAGSQSWPCPDATAILPCTCESIEDPENGLHVDCSSATTDSDIASAFSVIFPFDDIYNFTIETNGASNTIGIFSPNLFQTKWFTSIYIVETSLATIEENVFATSHDTLETLSLQKNKLVIFPFETILQYTKLRFIHLNGNNIKELPVLSSTNIHEVNMNGNPELVLLNDVQTFVGTPQMRTIKLSNTAVSRVFPNLFSTLQYITRIELSGNGITFLEPFAINAPESTIKFLHLADNALGDSVEPGAITGLAPDAKLDLRNNNIVDLTEAIWRPIFDQLGSVQEPAVGSIMLDGNNLRCGCEVNWIIIEEVQWKKISEGTTCPGGQLFSELDENFYLTNCPQSSPVLTS